jgi:hypothetical protein
MKTPLKTRGSRANDGRSARLGKKQPDGTHAHRIAYRRVSGGSVSGGDGLAHSGQRLIQGPEMRPRAEISASRHSP